MFRRISALTCMISAVLVRGILFIKDIAFRSKYSVYPTNSLAQGTGTCFTPHFGQSHLGIFAVMKHSASPISVCLHVRSMRSWILHISPQTGHSTLEPDLEDINMSTLSGVAFTSSTYHGSFNLKMVVKILFASGSNMHHVCTLSDKSDIQIHTLFRRAKNIVDS